MQLTVQAVERIKATAMRQEVPDSLCPGLYLIVQPSGKKAFVARYRFNGERRKKTLGAIDVVALSEARDKVRVIRREINEGRDPEAVAIIAAEDAETIKKSLVANIWPQYVERRLGKRKESSKKRFTALFEKHILPSWQDRRINSITKADVLEMVEAAEKRGPYAGNATVTVLSSFFKWALGRNLIEISPVTGVEKPISEKDNERKRTLNDSEIREVWNACDKLHNVFGPMFRMLLATGARRNEVAEMEWCEVDIVKREWCLPEHRSKNGDPCLIYLNDAALSILNSVPRIAGSKYIFSTTGKSPISGFSKAKSTLDKIVPLPNWRLHDLRRSFRTNLSRLKINSGVGEACLNHALRGVSRVYDRYDYWSEKREAWTRWNGLLARIMSGNAAAVAAYVKTFEPAIRSDEAENVLQLRA